jgi:hypothetical protein
MTDIDRRTRRGFLATAGSVAGGVAFTAGATSVQATNRAQNRTTRQFVVPKVEPFAGNLVGQFVLITSKPDEAVSPNVVSNCSFPNWKASETELYNGMLLDRVSDSPQLKQVDVYANGNKSGIDASQPFIVSKTTSCSNEYVGVEAQAVPERAADDGDGPTVTGTDPEPTTTGTTANDGGQPGFGALAGVAGVAGAMLLRAVRGEE